MLRTDFPFRAEKGPRRLLAFVLGEACLGFLALIATALTLFPMLFEVSARVDGAIEGGQWIIIGLFATEYGFALACTPDKRAFLRNPWRLLDLVTIVVPLATLIPTVSGALRSSPILRLVRLVRVVTMGVRASGAVVREEVRHSAPPAASAPARVTLLRGRGANAAEVSWSEFLQWVKTARGGLVPRRQSEPGRPAQSFRRRRTPAGDAGALSDGHRLSAYREGRPVRGLFRVAARDRARRRGRA